ncbi:MAG: hypothetical protein QME75_09150 [Deltaproteobacteria bacterium]|nr:hypothetical protein [Deltaproteobacteria bacterium]
MSNILGRLGLGLLPLAMTPLLLWLTGEGYLNFGGGCKDILALIPWLIWALAFFICSMVLWRKGAPLLRAALYAAAGATGIMVLLFIILLATQAGLLGIKPP